MIESIVKITNTTYRLLDFLPEGEPLKHKAKEKALAVLERVTRLSATPGWVSIKEYLSPEREAVAIELAGEVELLKNYLRLASAQGWIDAMNVLILIKEYDALLEFFSVKPGKKMVQDTSHTDTPDTSARQSIFLQGRSLRVPGFTKNALPRAQQLGKATARQEKIIQILEKKNQAQVADIIQELPKVTKRTIRRDLDELLKTGKIARVGAFNRVSYQISKMS